MTSKNDISKGVPTVTLREQIEAHMRGHTVVSSALLIDVARLTLDAVEAKAKGQVGADGCLWLLNITLDDLRAQLTVSLPPEKDEKNKNEVGS